MPPSSVFCGLFEVPCEQRARRDSEIRNDSSSGKFLDSLLESGIMPGEGGGVLGLRIYGEVPLENLKKATLSRSQIPENDTLLLLSNTLP